MCQSQKDLHLFVMEARAARRKQKRDAFFQPIFTIIQSLSIAVSMIRYYVSDKSLTSQSWTILRVLALIVCISSFVCWFIARRQLGLHLTLFARADGTLVTTGLYRYFRHPIYYFGTLSMVSYIFLINKPVLLLILVVIIPMQFVRSINERKVLRKKFEDEYDDYIERVWF